MLFRSILCGCRSSRDLEALARRHRGVLNKTLGLEFKRWPSDATFRYMFKKAHLQEFGHENAWNWARDAQPVEHAHRDANRFGAPVVAFLRSNVIETQSAGFT